MDKLLFIIILCFVIFLLLREFWCWYWKINERRNLLIEIKDKLEIIAQKKDAISEASMLSEKPIKTAKETHTKTVEKKIKAQESTWKCTCGTVNEINVSNCKSCMKYKVAASKWS